MPERVTASFIPKESLMQDRVKRPSGPSAFAFLNVVGIVIIILTAVSAGGIFLFKSYTEQSIASKKVTLDRQRAAFEPATIEDLQRLDARIQTARALLSRHHALSLVFDELEARTGGAVRFRSFSFEPAGQGAFVIDMSGSARSFNSVAIQSESFGDSAVIRDPMFSNLNLDTAGNVVFDFSATIDPSRIPFGLLIEPRTQSAPQPGAGESAPSEPFI
ncbi:hypothetical protein KGO06_01695 [Patescibacteria group bacterium]|nr:hypothetical protein [Patescibacteria group bacterium]